MGARLSTETYHPNAGRTDIHLRVLLTAFLLTSILFACERTLACGIQDINLSILLGHDVCGCPNSTSSLMTAPLTTYDRLYICPGNRLMTSSEIDINYCSNGYICERLLILAADVELNPGPVNEETQTLLKAISDSENRGLGEIQSVKNEMVLIRSELAEVKEDCIKTKLELNKTNQNQINIQTDVKNAQKDISDLYELRHQMQLDIDHLNDDFQAKIDLVEQMEDDIDALDAKSRNDTMRIFGLEEGNEESYHDLKANIVDNVLKIACPEETWEQDDIKRAFRTGGSINGKPRIVIMKFRYDDDKHSIYAGRDILRERGIRVGNDLTRRQREKLKAVKQTGRLGYFYRG